MKVSSSGLGSKTRGKGAKAPRPPVEGKFMSEQLYPIGKVLKNIPAPTEEGSGRRRVWPILEIGECFFVETEGQCASFISSQRYQLRKIGILDAKGRFTTQRKNNQIGIWRIK